ncbi:cobalamin-5'-phosphate synthase [Crinalium epipsammum PCC 9333]|uniref:Adenosylcobinamide-GDP ribazoletransferase n=1 Tax=Crinalium epipsammum PCC 9333 TaxID=1173022 RepID=K9W0H5_9CYAN|nr:adenosylcobinamide-GDP ribazoletransferase [Crinalium epipsammum]AFZ12915.1 cobalamin-5'-phosphate synthase [Crinalium epipsammum PCC 9333]
MYQILILWVRKFINSIAAAVAFYTCLPVPYTWALDFEGVGRLAPAVGLLIGSVLSLGDFTLDNLGMPVLTRSALVVVGWIGLTGGLHLDGVMDTADGLAVQDRQRRLQVMSDSATGAFGAMAAIALLLLKTVALSELNHHRTLALMAAAIWGRWGQVVAIAYYPYLKATGKGAFHKAAIRVPQDLLLGLILIGALSGLEFFWNAQFLPVLVAMLIAGCAIALLTGAWFNWQLGGHTGDTYGAVVEWTEAFILCFFTILNQA